MHDATVTPLPEAFLNKNFKLYFYEIPVSFSQVQHLTVFSSNLNMYQIKFGTTFFDLDFIADKMRRRDFLFSIVKNSDGYAEMKTIQTSNSKTVPKEAFGISELELSGIRATH